MRIVLLLTPLALLAACSSPTQPGNQTQPAPANNMMEVADPGEAAADASVGNIVTTSPDPSQPDQQQQSDDNGPKQPTDTNGDGTGAPLKPIQ